MALVLLARNPTDSVTYGLLPAAQRMGHVVLLLTDHPQAHQAEYTARRSEGDYPVPQVQGCEVTDLQAVLAAVTGGAGGAPGEPEAILSNSDHLQTQTALTAQYLGLPGKDWRSAIRARDKGLMRRTLRAAGLDDTPCVRLRAGRPVRDAGELDAMVYPAVLKPAAGVASEDVVLVGDRADLERRVEQVRARRPGDDLLLEGLIDGPLHTLETLGAGRVPRVLGSYRTTVSAAPYFIEERLTWQPGLPPGVVDAVLAQVTALGAGFGPCHTEFILTAAGPRIVEVNDRLIGDHCDFAMADLLGEPLFEDVIGVFLGRPPRAAPSLASGSRGGHGAPGAPPRQGLVHSVLAQHDGVLRSAPGRLHEGSATGDGVQLDYWPMRQPGDSIRVTGTNRDYLGAARVIGPDTEAVELATQDFLSRHRWVIE